MQSTEQNPNPFHRGEIAIQTRYGVEQATRQLGARVIRDHMLEQHRQFYTSLPFIIVGSVDVQARPWASILTGGEGFISSPEDRTLEINARPLLADPLHGNLSAGSDVGLLGIMLSNRRRNRLNGRITHLDNDGFSVEVMQSFGNCPKYIQQRELVMMDTAGTHGKPGGVVRSNTFSDASVRLIRDSDTLFIASQFSEDPSRNNNGVDVSHRGGKPGFVRIDNDRTLRIPDFAGNNHYNTLGNLLLNPKTGLLFMDFTNGDILYLTGSAEIIFEGEEIAHYEGAQRIIRFSLDEAIHVKNSLPLRWELKEYSKFLTHTGEWCIV